MPVANPADTDFNFYLKNQNPYMNLGGTYDTYGDVLGGTNWRNQQVAKRNALTGVAPAAVGSAITGQGGGRYSTLRLTKNPALEGLINTSLGNARTNSSSNYADLGNFLGQLGSNAGANARDAAQEDAFATSAFDGTLAARLAAARGGYDATQRASIASAGAALGDARSRYQASALGDITALQSGLADQRGRFETRTAADIAREVAARNSDLNLFGRSATRATDLAVNQANRANKAMFMQQGTGGGSYTNRLGLGVRTAAATDLQNTLAQVRMSNTEKELARRAGLTDTVGNLERGEISGAGSSRLALTGQLAGQERSDLGYTLGREDALNSSNYNADRGDIQYVQDQAGRLIVVRRNLRNSAAQDALLPITARNALQTSDMDIASRLGALDQSNNFYGIDDGTGDGYSLPRIPSYSRGRGGFNLGSSAPSSGGYYDGGDLGADPRMVRQQTGGITSRPSSAQAASNQRSSGQGYIRNDDGSYSLITAPGQSFNFGADYLGNNIGNNNGATDLYVPFYDPRRIAELQAYYE